MAATQSFQLRPTLCQFEDPPFDDVADVEFDNDFGLWATLKAMTPRRPSEVKYIKRISFVDVSINPRNIAEFSPLEIGRYKHEKGKRGKNEEIMSLTYHDGPLTQHEALV